MRHLRMVGLCLVAVFAMSAVAASSAFAVIKNPNKGKKIFVNCPVTGNAENGLPNELCIVGATEPKEGGKFKVGPITVPITEQIVLQYGIAENSEGEEFYVPPNNGVEAITPTPEKVPGEPIAKLTLREQNELGWPETLKVKYKAAQKNRSVRKVYETIELAGVPVTSRSNLLNAEGTAVEAPIKIKAKNEWLAELGDTCYIGSNTEPIVQHLTSGSSTSPSTGETITGSVGELEFLHEFNEVIVSHNVLVDNTYPVPGVACTGPYSEVISATIDKVFGIPAVAGASVTEIRGTLYNSTNLVAEEGGAT